MKNITTIIIDIDGTLTDGIISYGNDGNESKNFHVRDAKGISLAKTAGLKIVLMTSSEAKSVVHRANTLKITNDTHLGIRNKLKCLNEIKFAYNLDLTNIAFIGDDINDILPLEIVGLPIAVNDAVEEVKILVANRNGIITKKNGGNGAVREAIETILKEQGRWDDIIKQDLERQKNEDK